MLWLNLVPFMPVLIQQAWKKNKAIATTNGIDLSQQLFAEMFTDQNFVPAARSKIGLT